MSKRQSIILLITFLISIGANVFMTYKFLKLSEDNEQLYDLGFEALENYNRCQNEAKDLLFTLGKYNQAYTELYSRCHEKL